MYIDLSKSMYQKMMEAEQWKTDLCTECKGQYQKKHY